MNYVQIPQFSTKNPSPFLLKGLKSLAATYSPTLAVPSALPVLTTLFGKGRGGPPEL